VKISLGNPFEDVLHNGELLSWQLGQCDIVRHGCSVLYEHLMTVPPSRERSLALTKLEEFAMWSNRAILTQEVSK
jgi:hypothetical protein